MNQSTGQGAAQYMSWVEQKFLKRDCKTDEIATFFFSLLVVVSSPTLVTENMNQVKRIFSVLSSIYLALIVCSWVVLVVQICSFS